MGPPLDTQFNATTKTWSGSEEDHDKSLPIGSHFLEMLRQCDPKKILQIFLDTGEEMCAREMYLKSIRFGISLRKLGIKSGDIVSLISQNTPLMMPISVGLLCLGATVSYLDDNDVMHLTDEDNSLRRVNPKFIICTAKIVDDILDYAKDKTILTFGDNGGRFQTVEDLLINYEQEEEFSPVIIKDPGSVAAVIISSSGTTGKPKFISLTHGMFLSQFFRAPKPDPPFQQITLNICPMYWISGIACAYGDLSGLKTRIMTTQLASPQLIIETTQKYNATDVFCTANQLIGLLVILRKSKMPLPSLKIFSSGGALVPYNAVQEMRDYVPNGIVISGYGLTEVGGIVSIEVYGPEGAVGLLVKGMHIRIKGKNGELLGPNEEGAVWIKTEYEFLDYLNNEPARDSKIDKDGFLNTNDIGYFDDDGFLYLIGRKDDILEYQNNAVYASKIEAILLTHPELIEVCVVGVREPFYYDIPAAMIVKSRDSNLTADDVHLWIKDKLPNDNYKLRGGIYFVESLPKTDSGKIKKHIVKGRAFDLWNESGVKIEDFKF